MSARIYPINSNQESNNTQEINIYQKKYITIIYLNQYLIYHKKMII